MLIPRRTAVAWAHAAGPSRAAASPALAPPPSCSSTAAAASAPPPRRTATAGLGARAKGPAAALLAVG